MLVGNWVSAYDLLDLLIKESDIRVLQVGNTQPLSMTKDYASNLESK